MNEIVRVQIDFIVHGKEGVYDEEIRKLGGNVVFIGLQESMEKYYL